MSAIATDYFTLTEDEKIELWKQDQLKRNGVSDAVASAVASTIDLGLFRKLIVQDCPPLLAVEIAR